MAIYAISDLHLSFQTEKPMNIFEGWHDHISRLESNWRNKIGENDVVVIPGDISWGMDFDEAKKDFEFIESLPGKKIILKGNHDYWWSTRTKLDN